MTENSEILRPYMDEFWPALWRAPFLGTLWIIGLLVPVSLLDAHFAEGHIAFLSIFAVPTGLVIGLPFYILFGGLAFYGTLRLSIAHPFAFAVAGLAGNALAAALLKLLFSHDLPLAQLVLTFGSFVAPIWGFAFGVILRRRRALDLSERIFE